MTFACILKKCNTHPLLDWDGSHKLGVLLLQSSYLTFAQEYEDGLLSPEIRTHYQLLVIKPPKTTKTISTHFSMEYKRMTDLCLCSVLIAVSLTYEESNCLYHSVDNSISFCVVLSEISNALLPFLNTRSHKLLQHITPKLSVWMVEENG